MITRFNRYPGGKVLGFGTPTQIQKRHCFGPSEGQLIAILGIYAIGICSPFIATYLAYKSYKYFHNNYEIVRKNKTNDMSIELKEKDVSEEHRSMRRPGGMGSSGE